MKILDGIWSTKLYLEYMIFAMFMAFFAIYDIELFPYQVIDFIGRKPFKITNSKTDFFVILLFLTEFTVANILSKEIIKKKYKNG